MPADEVETEHASGAEYFPHKAKDGEGAGEAKAHAKAVTRTFQDTVLAGERLCPAKDDAVHHDKGNEEAQSLVHRRSIGLHDELEKGHKGCDDHDIHRDMDLVRDHRCNKGNGHVGKHQHEQRGKSH